MTNLLKLSCNITWITGGYLPQNSLSSICKILLLAQEQTDKPDTK